MGVIGSENQFQAIRLDEISTHWSQLGDPSKIILRYGTAIRQYLYALLNDPHEADEVAQNFLLEVFQKGFPEATPTRGRFRDYLKVCVRNAALGYVRHRQGQEGNCTLAEIEQVPEHDWLSQWRQCLLDRVWQQLEQHQYSNPGNYAYTVLSLVAENPKKNSSTLAAQATELTGHCFRADAFRKQLSRARRKFAEVLVAEVKKTLTDTSPGAIREELAELGLIPFVQDYLPRVEK